MPPKYLVIICCVVLAALTWAQRQSQPPVKVNVINVCAPSAEEQKEIASALARVPKQPLFSEDFEVDRGHSTLSENPALLQAGVGALTSSESSSANYVRIRREFSIQALFSSVQYSFSVDPKNMVETMVFRVRDPKDLMQLSVEDSASSVTTPAAMLHANTPASRIKLERFGKASVVLARCSASQSGPPPDQTAYEPLFQSASAVLANYRDLLGARRTVPEELARITDTGGTKPKSGAKPATKKPKPENR